MLAIAVLERPPPIQDQETLPQESGGRSDECRYQVTRGPSAKSIHSQELICDVFICKSTEECELDARLKLINITHLCFYICM